ncbi:MAG: (2Fe-2S)-binding protein [Spirochaetes bacterium]|nr:MAG: (2Fe-2S)-binding protein [Spirochaetota bacterium]
MDRDIIVCRCEDVSLAEIRELLREGYTSLDEIKRIKRCGMGPCQGKTCAPIILKEISSFTGRPVAELAVPSVRPPVGGIKLGEILGQPDSGSAYPGVPPSALNRYSSSTKPYRPPFCLP